MALIARLCTAKLNYPPHLTLFTASSGPVQSLDAIYLHLQEDGKTVGLGEMRENIEYLTGVPAATTRAALLDVLAQIDFRADPDVLLEKLPVLTRQRPSLVRALIDCTLHDRRARAANVPLAISLGGRFQPSMPSNQCVFWGSDADLEAQATSHLKRGFRHIKLRVAVADFEQDLRRFARLRELCGPHTSLSIDANGRWEFDQALEYINALAQHGVACVEQPLAAGAYDEVAELARAVSVPIMLDEGASSVEEAARIAGWGGLLQAHLKLVKLGGITPLMEAAQLLLKQNVPFMVGQMNEGAAATAAAAHCAMATLGATLGATSGADRVGFGELYGADGILDDPVTSIRYADGCVQLPATSGLGVELDLDAVEVIWQSQF